MKRPQAKSLRGFRMKGRQSGGLVLLVETQTRYITDESYVHSFVIENERFVSFLVDECEHIK